MRLLGPLGLALLLLASTLGMACSSSDTPSESQGKPDAGGSGDDDDDDDTPSRDGGSKGDAANEPDGATSDAGATTTEKEPNDGKTSSEIETISLPGSVKGAIDPANDVDLFSASLAPGDLWEWTVTPAGADLAPHLTIFDTVKGNLNPTVLATAGAGTKAVLQHFVIGTGSFVAALRDARNVPNATGKGGPSFGYTIAARKLTPSPKAVTFPSNHTGTLASLSSVDLFGFTLSSTMGFDIVVKAARKASPSTLDSRISLFDVNQKKNVITNDDASGATTDSAVGGTLPAGSYVLVLENEGTNGADLSYELSFQTR